jgi:hypothetical protein
MGSQRNFALLFLAGLIVLLIGADIISNMFAWIGSNLLNDPNALIPGCTIYGTGCLVWPYVGFAAVVIGLVTTMAGAIGFLESRFPRRDV